MEIKRLLLAKTGNYNNMVLRPYRTHVDINGVKALREAGGNRIEFEPERLAGVASQILSPSDGHRGQAEIPNGWNAPRLCFLMEVTESDKFGTELIQYVSGYTDYDGADPEGGIHPSMRFYLNRSIIVRRIKKDEQEVAALVRACHVLTGNYNLLDANRAGSTYLMRPEDVFSAMGLANMQLGEDVLDTRQTFANSSIKLSRMSHSIPSNYLSTIAEAYAETLKDADPDEDMMSLMATASAKVKDPLIYHDPFLSTASRQTDLQTIGHITYAELCQMQAGLDDRTLVIQRNNVLGQSGTETWNNTTPETLLATSLIHAVPATMVEHLFGSVVFSATNRTEDKQWQVLIHKVEQLVSTGSTTDVQDFVSRLLNEVLKDLPVTGREVEIKVASDLFAEMLLEITLDGNPPVHYCVPSFADALFAPVVADGQYALSMVAHDLSTLMDNLSQ